MLSILYKKLSKEVKQGICNVIGKCQICSNKTIPLVLHDKAGIVHGILCQRCNDILDNIYSYIEDPDPNSVNRFNISPELKKIQKRKKIDVKTFHKYLHEPNILVQVISKIEDSEKNTKKFPNKVKYRNVRIYTEEEKRELERKMKLE